MSYTCECDCEPFEFSRTSRQRCAKSFACDECNRTVAKGERYCKTVGKLESEVMTFKMCDECDRLVQWAQISAPCFCCCLGEAHRYVVDFVEAMRREIPGLFFEFGRRAVAIRKAGGTFRSKGYA